MFNTADSFKYAFDPILFARERLGFEPDPHRQRLLDLSISPETLSW